MHQYRWPATASRSAHTPRRPRACERRIVALRVDYVTSQGRMGVGLVHNLSLQGLCFDSASGPGTPELAPGDLVTVVVVLPAGRPCKLRAMVIHCQRQRCGVQFREVLPQAFDNFASFWASLEEAG